MSRSTRVADLDWLPFSIQSWLLAVVLLAVIARYVRADRKERWERRRVDPQRRAVVRLGGVLALGFAALGARLVQITVTDG
jgi:hypothetical protein